MSKASVTFADPNAFHPVLLADGSRHTGTVFLAAAVAHPRIAAGAYSYFSSHQPLLEPDEIASRLAPYLYPWSPEQLRIGKFCQIAHGVQIITSSANHRREGLSTYPFAIFDAPEERLGRASLPSGDAAFPDTIIGHDVWIGTGALILPGAEIGNGVIVGAGAVVSGHVPACSVVAGNPARVVRSRLDQQEASRMEAVAW